MSSVQSMGTGAQQLLFTVPIGTSVFRIIDIPGAQQEPKATDDCVALVLTGNLEPLSSSAMAETVTKSATIHIRTSPQHKRLLEQAAKLRHLGLSQFVLESSTRQAREEIASTTLFPLGAKQWNAFCQRLDEPVRDKPNLRRLLTEPSVFDA